MKGYKIAAGLNLILSAFVDDITVQLGIVMIALFFLLYGKLNEILHAIEKKAG